MKTFKSLKFKKHPCGNGLMARMNFSNGYGVSVVRFKIIYPDLPGFINRTKPNPSYGSYTDNESEWELAILKDNELCYDTDLTDDVIGHLDDAMVTEIMMKVQQLKADV